MSTLFSDVLDRETAWLKTSGDTLPDLTALFTIQARYPRTPTKKATSLYVMRVPNDSADYPRATNQRLIPRHNLMLRIIWPLVRNAAGSGEADILACEQAVDAVLARVMGLVGDHTHGGRFLSAAEDAQRIRVDFPDLEQAYGASEMRVHIFYSVDDFDVVN